MRIIGIDRQPIATIPTEIRPRETKPYIHPNQAIRSAGEAIKRRMLEARRASNSEGIIDIKKERDLRRSLGRRNASAITPPSGQDAYGSFEPRYIR